VVHNTSRGLEGAPAYGPELRGACAERSEPVLACRQRVARSVRCEPYRARTPHHRVWRAACGARECAGYGEGQGATVDLERYTGAPAGRGDTTDRGLWRFIIPRTFRDSI
jgi:hypothetical protein